MEISIFFGSLQIKTYVSKAEGKGYVWISLGGGGVNMKI